jgi:hypothetical protein
MDAVQRLTQGEQASLVDTAGIARDPAVSLGILRGMGLVVRYLQTLYEDQHNQELQLQYVPQNPQGPRTNPGA